MFLKNHTIFFLFFVIAFFLKFPLAHAQSDEIKIANEYYSAGELEKAKISYDILAKREENLLLIYFNYLNTLVSLKQPEEAEKLTKKMIRLYPEDVAYKIDHYLVKVQISGEEKAEKEFEGFLNDIKSNSEKVDRAGALFLQKGKLENAKRTYLAGRKASGKKTAFAIGLSKVYNALGEKEMVIEELLNLLEAEPQLMENIKIPSSQIYRTKRILIYWKPNFMNEYKKIHRK